MNRILAPALTVAMVNIALSACATLTEQAAKVQYHSQFSTALGGCKRLGPVSIKNARVTATTDVVTAKLRQAAADVGADTVVELNSDESLTEVTVQGMALKCY